MLSHFLNFMFLLNCIVLLDILDFRIAIVSKFLKYKRNKGWYKQVLCYDFFIFLLNRRPISLHRYLRNKQCSTDSRIRTKLKSKRHEIVSLTAHCDFTIYAISASTSHVGAWISGWKIIEELLPAAATYVRPLWMHREWFICMIRCYAYIIRK